MSIYSFFEKYFIQPIYTDSGYNAINSITYGILAFLILLGVFKIFKKISFKPDKFFFYSLIPYIFLGSSLRVFTDAKIYGIGFWTVSPGIYFLAAGIFFSVLGISLLIQKKLNVSYWKTTIGFGILILAANFVAVAAHLNKFSFSNLTFCFFILALAGSTTITLWLCFDLLRFSSGKKYFWPFPAHMLDASTTFIAVDFLGGIEKHPLPIFFTNLINTAAIMYLLKLLVLIPFIYFLDKYLEDKDFVSFFVIAIATLGLAEGIRNFLAVLLVF